MTNVYGNAQAFGGIFGLYPWLGQQTVGQQMENWLNALGGLQMMNLPALLMPIDRQMQADLSFKAQRFSQNWLNAMLDVELGLC